MKTKTVTMYRIVTVFLIFVLSSLLLAPPVFGLYLRSKIQSAIKADTHLPIVLSSYHIGWFSSKFNLRVEVDGDISIVLSNEVIHGPIYLGIPKSHKNFLISGYIRSEAIIRNDTSKRVDKLLITSVVDLSSQVSGKFFGEQRKSKKQSALPLYDSLSGDGEYYFNQQKLVLTYATPALTIHEKRGSLRIDKLSVKADLAFSTHASLLGRTDVQLGGVSYLQSEEMIWHLKDLGVHFNAARNNTLMNYQWRADFNEANISGENYSNGELGFVIRNVDAKLRKQVRSLMSAHLAASVESELPFEPSKVISLLPELLKNVEIELTKLYLETPRGFVDAWLRLSAPGVSGEMLLDPLLLLSAVMMKGEISVAESIVREVYESQAMNMFLRSNEAETDGGSLIGADEVEVQAKNQAISLLESLRNQRYIDLEAGQYISAIDVNNGEITINGQLFNPMLWVLPESMQKQ